MAITPHKLTRSEELSAAAEYMLALAARIEGHGLSTLQAVDVAIDLHRYAATVHAAVPVVDRADTEAKSADAPAHAAPQARSGKA